MPKRAKNHNKYFSQGRSKNILDNEETYFMELELFDENAIDEIIDGGVISIGEGEEAYE